MSAKKNKRRPRRGPDYYDYNLVAVVILLTCFGLVMLYSTSAYTAEVNHGSDMYFFGRQSAISLGGLILALLISRMDYHILRRFPVPIYVIAMILIVLVQTPLGVEVNGARRWLKLGIQFQPAELSKVAATICISCMICSMGKKIASLENTMKLIAVGCILGIMTYILNDNMSTGIIICGITVGLVFIAHPKTKPFLYIFGAGAAVVTVAVGIMAATLNTSSSFRIRRILVWLRPEENSADGGYQVMQALYAIGSGGLFGKGLGNSTQKLGAVPEAQNDMIFSIICEELGIFGGALVIVLFAYLLYRLFFIAQNASDLFGSLLVSGVFVHFALQVILNIAVVINLIPTTGITLPFVSYGGTSIVFLMAEIGMALSVARQIRFQSDESQVQ